MADSLHPDEEMADEEALLLEQPQGQEGQGAQPAPDPVDPDSDDDCGPDLQMAAASDIMNIEYDDSAGLHEHVRKLTLAVERHPYAGRNEAQPRRAHAIAIRHAALPTFPEYLQADMINVLADGTTQHWKDGRGSRSQCPFGLSGLLSASSACRDFGCAVARARLAAGPLETLQGIVPWNS